MNLATTLVIFDCDGVLVDSEHVAEAVTYRAMQEAGGSYTLDEFREAFLGRTDTDAMAAFEAHLGRPLPPGWHEERRRLEHEAFARDLRAVPGVVDAIDTLEGEGAATCVASSGPFEKMRVTLGLAGLWSRFDGRIYSATQVARGKPHPDLFCFAARQMGFPVDRCVVVEDTRNGVAGALAAQMRVVGYTGSTTPAEWLVDATAQVADMTELPATIARL